MNLLMLSTDKRIFESGSAVQKRMQEYGALFDSLQIIVFTPPGCANKLVLAPNVTAYATNARGRWRSFWRAYLIARQLSLVQVITAQDPFEIGFFAAWLAGRIGAKLHVQVHTDFLSPYFPQYSRLGRLRVALAGLVLPRAQGIRVVSQKIALSLKAKYPLQAEPVVLPIFSDFTKMQASTSNGQDIRARYPQWQKIFLMPTRLTVEKNISLALEALGMLVRSGHTEVGLLVVGDGPLKSSLQRWVEEHKLTANIVLVDWQQDVSAYYRAADAYLLTSWYEGYPMAVTEALAHGVPVVSTAVGSAGELLRHEDNSLIVPVNDVESLQAAMLRLLDDPKLCERLRQGALQTIQKLPSKAEYLVRFQNLFNL